LAMWLTAVQQVFNANGMPHRRQRYLFTFEW